MSDLSKSPITSAWFYFHLVVVILSWAGPFLVSWYILDPVYILVIVQFIIFDRCLVNARHGLHEGEDRTFYSELFESMGLKPKRRPLKIFVRRYLYILLSIAAILIQEGLHFKPLWF